MAIPLLEITPTTQNQRVAGYEVPDEDDPTLYRLNPNSSESDVNEIIWAAYRQIFSEQLILKSHRQVSLESLLRNRSISLREFIRGLGKSEVYRNMVAETNSNYRLVDITFKRFLGRASYNKDEQISWSIVIATKGLHGFIDAIVDSEEYLQNFGDDLVPYQRRRFNERPFNLVNPRYSDYWRTRLIQLEGRSYYQVKLYGTGEPDKQVARRAIPSNFLEMARSIVTPQVNYQRYKDRAINQARRSEIPDMTRQGTTVKPAVSRTEVALPYRYIPSDPKV
ncbi:phycobilisome rod-core linker polypeptide [Planktothrix sp. FACHB-1355]|uniref:Phycobilisome rod-core linker polypeptide n=1 Tax=Aerosakkonema funiforme FACHB-1375 TaxID=2949571 RepID=A0A926VM45_9CYAN|nr:MULTISPECIES: phycobilisome rod-core linker polypeptide [Oscillatoriales]MBD2184994.1 phycobilisome rod-core linker polypeptide [Aerosakkonema funiforme FACHB-1375]MBD3558125.1 phycobilisome rod-core linker polypeptide [Planktothrix sp. FACHB-1355]